MNDPKTSKAGEAEIFGMNVQDLGLMTAMSVFGVPWLQLPV